MNVSVSASKVVRSFKQSAAWLARLSGLVALFSVPIKQLPERIESFLPIDPDRLSNLVAIIVGLLLFYIGGQLARKKRRAYYIAVGSLAILIGTELLYFRSLLLLSLYIMTLTSLLIYRREFTVKSDEVSLKRGLLLSASIIGAALLFGVVAFSFIDQRDFGRNYTTGQTLNYTARWAVGLPNPNLAHLSREDRSIIDSLRVATLTAAILGLVSLFRPIRFRLKVSARDIARARDLIQSYSDSSEDFFKLWPQDKHYFFHGESFVAYTVKQSVALILDGPTGQSVMIPTLMKNFVEFCEQNGWLVAIVHASDKYDSLWRHDLRMDRLFIGNEALVDIAAFRRDNERDKHFRYVSNKASKENLRVEFWEPPLHPAQIAALRAISDAWLKHNKRREYTFSMGYFDSQYIASCRQAVLFQKNTAIAYVNFIPVYCNHVASIDHMRFKPGVTSVGMHFLLLEAIKYLQRNKWSMLNLGLVPLSGIEERRDVTLSERVLRIVKRLGGRYYSFGGLEQFKNKFSPQWQPRYLYHQAGSKELLRVISALSRATSRRNTHRSRRFPIVVALIAGLAYASFPLAIWLNAPYAFHGLVSILGESGQPNAGIFNALDVISGMLFSGLTLYLLASHKPMPPLWQWAIACLGVSALGAIIAAVLPLPAHFVLHANPLQALRTAALGVILHGIFSLINTAAFIVSTILWMRIEHVGERSDKRRFVLGSTIIILPTLGPLLTYLFPSSGGFTQRLFICLFAVWAIVFVHDALVALTHRSNTMTRSFAG